MNFFSFDLDVGSIPIPTFCNELCVVGLELKRLSFVLFQIRCDDAVDLFSGRRLWNMTALFPQFCFAGFQSEDPSCNPVESLSQSSCAVRTIFDRQPSI